MKLKNMITTFMVGAFLFTGAAYAGDVDILLNKLVEKNILTKEEAKGLSDEMKKDGEKKVTAGEGKEGFELPKWIKNTEVKGDVRVRYQSQDTNNDGKVSRNRGRIRARLGVVSKPNDKWEGAIGLATGGSDPRSTNQTLENTFQTPDIRLDYAYAKYSPNKVVTIMAGKMANPIWGTKDLLWDTDIYPDGLAAALNFKINDNFEIFATPAYFLLDEYSSSKSDPYMTVLQSGIKTKVNKNIDLKFAAAYYNFSHMEGNDFSEFSSGTNSTIKTTTPGVLVEDDPVRGDYITAPTTITRWVNEYDGITLDGEIGFKMPESIKYVETLSLFGQYVNSDADTDNTGFLYGVNFGDKSVKEAKDWQVKINYRKLERDAWADFMPDSDFYNGATNVKGMEYELTVGLAKNISLGLDYYHARPILGNTTRKEGLFQADLVVKY
jgi:polyhydroxyalkanoate synthesis regulator phasin